MHSLQPKHSKLKAEEADALLNQLNISTLQLPKMKKNDPALPPDVKVGDIIKIERKSEGDKTVYYRVVVPE